MAGGLNVRFNITRVSDMADDYVGGAVSSGTVHYTNIAARFEGTPPEQMFLFQGLETNRIFRVVLVPGTLDIREHDQMTLVAPANHIYYNKVFRVIGVTYSDFNPSDRRNYLIVDVDRNVIAHSQQ